jgi:hypothetical protein
MTTWSDTVTVHPAADLFPKMCGTQLDELAADIAEHGLQEPIVWFGGQLLDGRSRIAAIERIPDEQLRKELQERVTQPQNRRILTGSIEPHAYVVSANMHRRHLTSEQKRDAIAALLKANPERSDRLTAKIAKTSPTTVGTVRQKLERTGDVSKLDTRADTKGRHQPASKPKRVAAQSPRLNRDSAIMSFSALLRAKARDTLGDLVRLLRDEQARIEALPMSMRVELAKGFLSALSVGTDDLRSALSLPSSKRSESPP